MEIESQLGVKCVQSLCEAREVVTFIPTAGNINPRGICLERSSDELTESQTYLEFII